MLILVFDPIYHTNIENYFLFGKLTLDVLPSSLIDSNMNMK